MFKGCNSLLSLKLSNFDITSVRYFSQVFCDFTSLKLLVLSNSKFTISKASLYEGMISNCNSILSLDLSNYNYKYYDIVTF